MKKTIQILKYKWLLERGYGNKEIYVLKIFWVFLIGYETVEKLSKYVYSGSNIIWLNYFIII